MIEQRERETDHARSSALSDRRVPPPGKRTYLRQRHKRQPRQRHRKPHKKSAKTLGAAHQHVGQPKTALRISK